MPSFERQVRRTKLIFQIKIIISNLVNVLTIFSINCFNLIHKCVSFHVKHQIVWVTPNFWTVVYIIPLTKGWCQGSPGPILHLLSPTVGPWRPNSTRLQSYARVMVWMQWLMKIRVGNFPAAFALLRRKRLAVLLFTNSPKFCECHLESGDLLAPSGWDTEEVHLRARGSSSVQRL